MLQYKTNRTALLVPKYYFLQESYQRCQQYASTAEVTLKVL